MSVSIADRVSQVVNRTPVFDLHTHLYPANFSGLCLWGVDELVTYHYLIAEVMRVSDVSYDAFWAMNPSQRADHIWQKLFVENAPVSEACRGVLTVLSALGIDPNMKNLAPAREALRGITPAEQIDRTFKLANIRGLTMTNDPLDPTERAIWEKSPERDPRFGAVLRIDPLLLGWPAVGAPLRGLGYNAADDLTGKSLAEVRRFIDHWAGIMDAQYVAVSLTPDWTYPDESPATRVIREAILPVCRERNLPFALMIGVKRQVNPLLKLAGDSVGTADLSGLERLLAENPKNKFLCTVLSRENQHQLAVIARKFRNLLVFGCWWFVNNPSLIEEITRMRMELLGPSFVPQHSDCRIVEQLIYKWDHSKKIIARVLTEKLADIESTGATLSDQQLSQLVAGYLGETYERFRAMPL